MGQRNFKIGVFSGTIGPQDGIIQYPTPPNRIPAVTVDVSVSAQQLTIMEQYAISQLGPNNYGLISMNCVQFVDSVFEAAAVPVDWREGLTSQGGMPRFSLVELSIFGIGKSVASPLAPGVPHFAHENFVKATFDYNDPITQEKLHVAGIRNMETGEVTPLTVTVGRAVYPAGSMGTGTEMNGLEQLAYESYMRSIAASNSLDVAVSTGWTRHDPGGPGGGGSGGSGGDHRRIGGGNKGGDKGDTNTGGSAGGSPGGLSGGSRLGGGNGGDKGKIDKTATGNGSSPRGTSCDEAHNSGTSGHGNIMPVILDLDGDGVEIAMNAQISFDWDGDGFRESGNWAAADDGFLVVDPEAANLPTAPRRGAA